MRLATLLALALLPFALGIPVADNSTDPEKTGDSDDPSLTASYSKWRVYGTNWLKCHYDPYISSGVVTKYPKGTVITAKCWTKGEYVYGNPYWDKTYDYCYVSDYYLQYVSGYYSKCK